MVTGELKRRVDALWTEFWQGGITNPLTVIEQITFLMYARLLDINEARDENRQKRTGKSFQRRFKEDEQHLRWSQFRHLGSDQMLPLVRDKVFPHFRSTVASGTAFAEFMKDAQLMIQKPGLLVKAVNMIHELPLTEGDTKGDLYEYLLSKLTTAGINGQFRTPRHIIRLMVDMLEPKPTDVIGDPACGTGGFLVSVMEYLLETYTSPEAVIEEKDPETGAVEKIFTGDLLEEHRDHIRSSMFHGFDFDATMLRIAAMNLMLHGVDDPDIHYQDTLSTGFSDKFPRQASEGFDVILANPPFKGSLDFEDVHSGLLRQVKTKKPAEPRSRTSINRSWKQLNFLGLIDPSSSGLRPSWRGLMASRENAVKSVNWLLISRGPRSLSCSVIQRLTRTGLILKLSPSISAMSGLALNQVRLARHAEIEPRP